MRVSESQKLGSAAVLAIALTVYGVAFLHARQPYRGRPVPWGSQGPALMAVEVAGDREKGGIYFLPEGMTAGNVLSLVGIPEKNPRGKIDPAVVTTGSALRFSVQGEVSIGEMAAARKLALGLPVDLNRISEEELCLVPGIGPKTAYQIMRLRRELGEFRDVADLMAVPGIKGKKLEGLNGYLTVRKAPQ